MRKPRILKPGARYHVIARANRQEMILSSCEMKKLFLNIVKRAKARYNFAVYNFCIMGNHFHFILEPRENENLSRIMQWILSVFAIRFNKRFNYFGHVWYDRFWSRTLDDIRQFAAVFDYIVNNPVTASMVSNPLEFDFCGIRHLREMVYEVIEPPGLLLYLLFPQYLFQCRQLTA